MLFSGTKNQKKTFSMLDFKRIATAIVDHCHLDNWARAEEIASSPGARQGFQHVLTTCQASSLPGYILVVPQKGDGYGPAGQYPSSLWTPIDPMESMLDGERNWPLPKLSDASCHSQSWQVRCEHQALQYYAHVYTTSMATPKQSWVFLEAGRWIALWPTWPLVKEYMALWWGRDWTVAVLKPFLWP